MADIWLPSLKTATPQEGFDLATKMARVGVKVTQPSAEIRDKLRAAYTERDYRRGTESDLFPPVFPVR